MNQAADASISRVVAIVKGATPRRFHRRISDATTINYDLGIDGDDAYDLIAKLCAEFRVTDDSDFPWDRYFFSESEIVNPFLTMRRLLDKLLGMDQDSKEPLPIKVVAAYFDQKTRAERH
ncbi:MAG: DUF1493 family protein [Bauldia sp.]|nr:DUF1493 family protein [Bauldia sp.]